MAVLPLSSLVKPHPQMAPPFSHTRFAAPIFRKPSHVVIVSTAAAATIRTNPSKTNPTQIPKQLEQLSLGPIGPVADQITFKGRSMNNIDHQNEVSKVLMERLERVGERMREMELEKLKGRWIRSGDDQKQYLSKEESELVEKMSREIVGSFLEKPIHYLNKFSNGARLEDKLKDLEFFVCILEESCFIKEKTSILL